MSNSKLRKTDSTKELEYMTVVSVDHGSGTEWEVEFHETLQQAKDAIREDDEVAYVGKCLWQLQ